MKAVMKKRIHSFFKIWAPGIGMGIALLVPSMVSAQDPAASTATTTDMSGFASSINILNLLLIIIGLELAFIALVLAIRDPKNFGLGAFLGSITGRTASVEEMDHAYDGITEIDNPVPAWLKGIFYVTIVWAFAYIIYYHFSSAGYTQLDEYNAEMAMYEKAKSPEAALKLEDLKVQTDAAVLEQGKKVYSSICYSCHGKEGQGDSGPNLTDEYWIHGGTISEIFTVISEGVAGKAMSPWKGQFSDKERLAVSSYIISLKGSNPPNPRKAEGELFSGDHNAMPGAQSAPADSAKTDTTK